MTEAERLAEEIRALIKEHKEDEALMLLVQKESVSLADLYRKQQPVSLASLYRKGKSRGLISPSFAYGG